MIPSLLDLLSDWLRSPIGGREFYIDVQFGGLIRCANCICFTAFINPDNLFLRLEDGSDDNYRRIMAADQRFFADLTKHLIEHACLPL